MIEIPPDEIPLPAFLDPVLEFLADALPPNVYSILFNFLSYSLAIFSSLLSLGATLIRSKPWEWDAQTILPPLITLLACYLALVNLYRTTSWMVRTGFWLAKWGAILAALAGGAGWFAGNGGVGDVARNGIVSTLGGMVLDMINGQGQNAAGTSRNTRHRSSTRKRTTERDSKKQERPKPWESFDKHRQWQQAGGAEDGEGENQDVMGNIMRAAGRVLKQSGWMEMAKGVMDQLASGEDDEDESASSASRKQPPRKAKGKTSKSKGSR